MTDEYDFLTHVIEGADEEGFPTITLPSTAPIGTEIHIKTKPGQTYTVKTPATFHYDLGGQFILTKEIFDEIYEAGQEIEAAFDDFHGSQAQVNDARRKLENLLKKYKLEQE